MSFEDNPMDDVQITKEATCPKCGAAAEAERAWSCGSWDQHGFFRSEQCRDNQLSRQAGEIARLEGAEATLLAIEQIIPRNEAHRDYAETVQLEIERLIGERDGYKQRFETWMREADALAKRNLELVGEKIRNTLGGTVPYDGVGK